MIHFKIRNERESDFSAHPDYQRMGVSKALLEKSFVKAIGLVDEMCFIAGILL